MRHNFRAGENAEQMTAKQANKTENVGSERLLIMFVDFYDIESRKS
jgi:hypothetical protein